MVARPCRRRRPSSLDDGGISGLFLGLNLPKEAKDLYLQNYKTLMKEIEDDKTDGKIYHVLGLETLVLSK